MNDGSSAMGLKSSIRPNATVADLGPSDSGVGWLPSARSLESVYDKLFNTFGLWQERPHDMAGLRARLAARMALHNFRIWLNERLGRPRLAFADLLGW